MGKFSLEELLLVPDHNVKGIRFPEFCNSDFSKSENGKSLVSRRIKTPDYSKLLHKKLPN